MKKNESGRSMVEMLGVLAVVGVLSVVAVAGLRTAMDKHYANQTVNRLRLRAMSVSSQRLLGQTPTLNDFNATDGKYPITLDTIKDGESFSFIVNDIPAEVCEQIMKMDWNLAKISPADCSENNLKFKFLNDLSDCSQCVADSVDCTQYGKECGTCSVVKGYTKDDGDCADSENGPYCTNGFCAQCQNGTVLHLQTNTCWGCKSGSSYPTLEVYKYSCLGTMFYENANQRLRSCDRSEENTNIDEKSCKECTNRCFYAYDNSCRLTGTGRAYARNADGTCSCATNELTIFYQNYCYYCPVGQAFHTGATKCKACEETKSWYSTLEVYKHNCPGTMFYSNADEALISCYRGAQPSDTDAESCKKCGNRCYLNGICYFAGEGYAHQRVSDTDGTCAD